MARQAERGKLVFIDVSDFLRMYRNVPHMTTGRTPAELLFGRALCTHITQYSNPIQQTE